MPERHIRPGIYQHFKGHTYLVFGVSEHTENGERNVIYTPISNSNILTKENVGEARDMFEYLKQGVLKLWERPYVMFASEVDHKKYPNVNQTYRFEFIKEWV